MQRLQMETNALIRLLKCEISKLQSPALPDNALLTPAKAASIYGIGQKLIIKLCDDGAIPCIFKGTGANAHRLIRKKDLDKYIDYLFSKQFIQNDYFTRNVI